MWRSPHFEESHWFQYNISTGLLQWTMKMKEDGILFKCIGGNETLIDLPHFLSRELPRNQNLLAFAPSFPHWNPIPRFCTKLTGHCPVGCLPPHTYTPPHWWTAMPNKLSLRRLGQRQQTMVWTSSLTSRVNKAWWSSQDDANGATVGKRLPIDSQMGTEQWCAKLKNARQGPDVMFVFVVQMIHGISNVLGDQLRLNLMESIMTESLSAGAAVQYELCWCNRRFTRGQQSLDYHNGGINLTHCEEVGRFTHKILNKVQHLYYMDIKYCIWLEEECNVCPSFMAVSLLCVRREEEVEDVYL